MEEREVLQRLAADGDEEIATLLEIDAESRGGRRGEPQMIRYWKPSWMRSGDD